jgi:hypothetical protein
LAPFFKDLVYIACGAPLGRNPLDSAKNFDIDHPAMDQVGRLLERFSMDYCKFLQTQDEAIEHCRLVNRGLRPTDPGCCAVVVGPEDNNYAVVDLRTAKDLLDDGDSGLTCLVVTD